MAKNNDLRHLFLSELLIQGHVTRSDFIAKHACRPASLLDVINQLKDKNMVVEPDRNGFKTGRRSPSIQLNSQAGTFIGLELQPNGLLGCVVDAAGNLLEQFHRPYPRGVSAETMRQAIDKLLEKLRATIAKKYPPLLGIGFADPGLVDMPNQISLQAVNVPGWENLNIGNWLRQMTDVSNTLIVPETMARTFAEYHAMQPNPPTSLFHISLNTGIGGGFIKHGKLFVGDTGRSMEIGHMVVQPDGPLCQCGNRGCLEAIAGENGIRNKVTQWVASGVRTELASERFEMSRFVEAVRNQDRAAIHLAEEICQSIAACLAITVSLLNPSAIMISGQLTGLGRMLLDTIKRILAVRCFAGAIDQLRVEYSSLDDWATCIASAQMIRHRTIRGTNNYTDI